MWPHTHSLLILILTLIVIYCCTTCYIQWGDNRELEEKITFSEKQLIEKIKEYEIENKLANASTLCTRELQTKKENVEECTKLLETQGAQLVPFQGLQQRIKAIREGKDKCILRRDEVKAKYEECNRNANSLFKNGNKANKIKNFVLFIGYPSSGHSIVAALLDAHPHVVISHELLVLQSWRESVIKKKKYSKYEMFNEILSSTERSTVGQGRRSKDDQLRYYTLDVPGLFQGQYEDYIEIIGDKRAGSTINMDDLTAKEIIVEFGKFETFEGYPLKLFHVVRNPYDNISTRFMVYTKSAKIRNNSFLTNKVWNDTNGLSEYVTKQASDYERIQQFLDYFGDRVLTLHNADLIADPKSFLNKVCNFLEIGCNSFYIETAAKSVFSNATMSRHNVMWSDELRARVDSTIQKYSFLDRYSFEK